MSEPLVGVVLSPDAEGGVRIAAVTPGGAAADAGRLSGELYRGLWRDIGTAERLAVAAQHKTSAGRPVEPVGEPGRAPRVAPRSSPTARRASKPAMTPPCSSSWRA